MKRKTGAAPYYDAVYERYSGKKRSEVENPRHRGRLTVAAPDENSAIVAAALYWGERWTSYDFYAYCRVHEVRPSEKAVGR